ncbi:MAG: methyltransferase domain-containing protein [Boseongicola sp.]|nr:MAG: methyltransferase domain-containing protein [Boseongicola sp.]
MSAHYDTIGLNYANLRMPDPRIARVINEALGDAQTILNVGAGTGSYEPADRDVTAVEPSAEMIAQRREDAGQVIQGSAENLPFDDNSFDAAMAVLTIHHWSDQPGGLREMRRVARGPLVLLTYDPTFRDFWLLDYVPELTAVDDDHMPALPKFAEWLGQAQVTTVPVPADCQDGFLSAYWRRPAAYLDPKVRAAMSSFWAIGDVSPAMKRLSNDLESGEWDRKYGSLMSLEERDCGYRLVTSV